MTDTINNHDFRSTDIVFANLVKQGHEVLSLRLTGVRNLGDIISYIRRIVDENLGLVVMKIRNFTQGWALQQGLMLRPAELPEGTQYSLF